MKIKIKVGLFLALKNIFKKKFLFLLIILIIALGFINMVFFTAFTNGLSNAINEGVINMQFGNIVIEPKNDKLYIDNANSLLRKINSIPGVISSTRRYYLGAILYNKNKKRTIASWLFQAIDPEKEKKVTVIQDYLKGNYLSQNDQDILIGAHIAGSGSAAKFMPIEETLEVTTGDKVSVTYNTGFTKEYSVKGIIDGRDFYAVMSSYITIQEAEKILNITDKASIIIVKIPTGQEKKYIKMFKELGINENIFSWEEKAGQANLISGMFEVVNKIFYIVGIIIIFFTIYVATNINVINRRKELGILKAIGIQKSSIELSYIFTSILYGFFGILTATIIIKIIIAHFIANPIDTPLGYLYPVLKNNIYWLSVVIALLSTIIGSILPIKKEMKKNIITLIWK